MNRLPQECVGEIVSHLDFVSAVKFGMTASKFRGIVGKWIKDYERKVDLVKCGRAGNYASLLDAARDGYLDVVKSIAKVKKSGQCIWWLCHDLLESHNIFQYFEEEEVSVWYWPRSGWCLDRIKLLIDKGDSDFSLVAHVASMAGHEDIVQFLNKKYDIRAIMYSR